MGEEEKDEVEKEGGVEREEEVEKEDQKRNEDGVALLFNDLEDHKMEELSLLGGYLKKLQQSHDLIAIYYSSWHEKEPGKVTRLMKIFYFFFVLLISLSTATFIGALFVTSCDRESCHKVCVQDFSEDVCKITNGTFHFPYSKNVVFCSNSRGCFESEGCVSECDMTCYSNITVVCPSQAVKSLASGLFVAPFTTFTKFFVRFLLAYLLVAISCKGYCVILRRFFGVILITSIVLIFVILMVVSADFLVSILPSFGSSLLLSLFVTDPIVILCFYLLLDRKCLKRICCCCCTNKGKTLPKHYQIQTPTYKYVYVTVPTTTPST